MSAKQVKRHLVKIFAGVSVFLILMAGIIKSNSPYSGLYELVKVLEYVFLFSYTAKNFRNLNGFILFSIFIFGILFESLLTIAQYLNQGSIGGILYFLGERSFNSQTPGIANASINGQLFLRPYATFSHPNVLAGYLFVFLVLIVFYAKQKFFKQQKAVVFFSLTLGTAALFLTMSRVSIFAWGIAVLFFLTYGFWKKTRMSITKKTNLSLIKNKLTILLFLAAALFVFTFPIGLRLFQFSFSDQTVVEREILINDAIVMAQKNPILGVGLNNFLVNLPLVQKQSGEVLYIQPVHNIFLLVLSQTGIIVFVSFLYFIMKTYKRIKKNTNVIFLVLFLLILFLGLFDHYFFTLQQGQILFAVIFGIFWSNFQTSNKAKRMVI